MTLLQAAFAHGGLQRTSYACPGKLFTAHETLFAGVSGQLSEAARQAVMEQIFRLLHPQATKNGAENRCDD